MTCASFRFNCSCQKFLCFILMFWLVVIPSFGQDVTSAEWKKIKNSDDYIIGYGVAADIDAARQSALNALTSQIMVSVQSQFSYIASEENKDGGLVSEEKMNNIVNSYSSATLKNVKEYVEKGKSEYNVYRFMKRSDMYAMFTRRVGLARKWMYEGRRNEKCGKIGDALQNYYWSLALLRSCPDGDIEMIEDDLGNYNMMQHIHKCVKEILSAIEVNAISVEPDDDRQLVSLQFLYKGEPAVNFNYSLADTKEGISESYTAKNGLGEISLPKKYKLNRLRINTEYVCMEEANINSDLRSVIASTTEGLFPPATIKVESKNCKSSSAGAAMAVEGKETASMLSSSMATLSGESLKTVVGRITDALAKRKYSDIEDLFTQEGFDMFRKLINYGEARLLHEPTLDIRSDGKGGMVCRGFPMSFSFKNNRRIFTEDVVFYFNPECKVQEVAFGLEKEALKDIQKRGEWEEEARNVMIHFLETYKTAYALERLDYINSIFSSDALIITGSVVMTRGKSDFGVAMKKHVKYTRQTKEEYMDNLKKCFASNEFINIHFADNIVRRSNSNTNIYGIQIKQDYYSSNYGDTGYLFLLIDFSKMEFPVIHVRTWQPDLDPNIKDGRIGITDFML